MTNPSIMKMEPMKNVISQYPTASSADCNREWRGNSNIARHMKKPGPRGYKGRWQLLCDSKQRDKSGKTQTDRVFKALCEVFDKNPDAFRRHPGAASKRPDDILEEGPERKAISRESALIRCFTAEDADLGAVRRMAELIREAIDFPHLLLYRTDDFQNTFQLTHTPEGEMYTNEDYPTIKLVDGLSAVAEPSEKPTQDILEGTKPSEITDHNHVYHPQEHLQLRRGPTNIQRTPPEDEQHTNEDHPTIKLVPTSKLGPSAAREPSGDFLESTKPSEITDRDHVYHPPEARDIGEKYPRSGKWMLFYDEKSKLDADWSALHSLYERGPLIGLKASTGKEEKTGLINCYNVDATDVDGVRLAADAIRELVRIDDHAIFYKSTVASKEGQYRHEGSSMVSMYMSTVRGGFYAKDHLKRWTLIKPFQA